MFFSIGKKPYVAPESSEDVFIMSALIAESNTEPISDDDNDLVW